ncbi:hypothetical protein OB13_05270 [Pontibacter sp. HJ8]
MKLKNSFLPAMLFFGVVALSSCEKSEQNEADPTFDKGALSHVMMDSSEVTSFRFAGKQLTQVNHYDKESGEIESFEKFERDDKGRLVKATSYIGKSQAIMSEQVYTYNDKGELSKTNTAYFTDGKPDYNTYATYEYDAAKKLSKKSVHEGTEGKEGVLKSFTKYEVLPNGNYSQEKQYIVDATGLAKLFSTTTNSFDANQNPFHEFAEPGTASSPNNLIRSTAVVHNSKKTYTHSYLYKYDERGYPISQTVTSPNGKSQTFTYMYSN